jgi:ribosome biogenesis GTPase A
LNQTIDEFEKENSNKNTLLIPQKLNQQHKLVGYNIDDCTIDQKEVLAYMLQFFKKWYEMDKTPELLNTFTPLRMTVCGVAGSGKSTLINTFVSIVRTITQKTDSIYVCGPTGSAAFNAGGETCHRLFNIQGRLYNAELSPHALKHLCPS